MTNKIFRSGMLLSLAVIAICISVILLSVHGYLNKEQEERLRDELKLVEAGIELKGIEYLESLEKGDYRITLVNSIGVVLFDSKEEANNMENHMDREEIALAQRKGIGKSQRFSKTLLNKNSYLAKKLSDGNVLRVSVNVITLGGLTLSLLNEVVAVIFLTLLLAIFLSFRLAKKIVKPINEVDLENPLSNEVYEEISPLLRRVEKQKRAIVSQMKVIEQKKEEFSQIINCMSEGLVLLDKNRKILSMNQSAKDFFEVGEEWIRKEFLNIDRGYQVEEAIRVAVEKGHSEHREEKEGRKYQFNISRLNVEERFAGIAILIFDISEREMAERQRKEFSANVSHELKTPLQSIMGSAELLENGLVKEEDVPTFVGRIRKEAARLLVLIEDIIKLSRLDEGSEPEEEDVSLSEIITEATKNFSEKAKKEEVEISFEEGEKTIFLRGIRQMMVDIVYNLLENAIKYNKKGGKVLIELKETEGEICLSVKDTGIGIPLEHRERVFERFYCVDKSHSKKTGGTGLGLAIVKHAVLLLGGRISLESEVNEGTEIKIFFCKR